MVTYRQGNALGRKPPGANLSANQALDLPSSLRLTAVMKPAPAAAGRAMPVRALPQGAILFNKED